MNEKIVISASRRTDIPAFYTEWFLKSVSMGKVEVENPYNKKKYCVSLKKNDVHSIVLWSKNFYPLLKRINELNHYHLFFMYTLNDCSYLEQNVPDLNKRFEQIDFIIKKFGKEYLFLRFDPLVFWQENKVLHNNISTFKKVIEKLAFFKIMNLKTSFMDTHYKKLKTRNVQFIEVPHDQKLAIVKQFMEIANQYGIQLEFCCNEFLFKENLPGLIKASCINGKYLANVTGEPTILKKDKSQRKDCQCTYSRDIGSYSQVCYHKCLYCYANPIK